MVVMFWVRDLQGNLLCEICEIHVVKININQQILNLKKGGILTFFNNGLLRILQCIHWIFSDNHTNINGLWKKNCCFQKQYLSKLLKIIFPCGIMFILYYKMSLIEVIVSNVRYIVLLDSLAITEQNALTKLSECCYQNT